MDTLDALILLVFGLLAPAGAVTYTVVSLVRWRGEDHDDG